MFCSPLTSSFITEALRSQTQLSLLAVLEEEATKVFFKDAFAVQRLLNGIMHLCSRWEVRHLYRRVPGHCCICISGMQFHYPSRCLIFTNTQQYSVSLFKTSSRSSHECSTNSDISVEWGNLLFHIWKLPFLFIHRS